MLKYHFKFKRYAVNIETSEIIGTKGRPLVTMTHGTTGYGVITVRENGEQRQYRAHRFIYECFKGAPIEEGMVINHIDGNKLNNHISNLEEITCKENTQHAFALGLMKPKVGESNGNAEISADTVRNIIRDIMSDHFVTNIALGTKYSLNDKHISLIRHKSRWKFIFDEPEFIDYVIPKSKQNTPEKYTRMLKAIHYIKTTTLSNAEIGRRFNFDSGTISRVRHSKMWESAMEKYNKETSTTIENLFTKTELVEYTQVSGSGIK